MLRGLKSIRSQILVLVVGMFLPAGALLLYDRAILEREMEARAVEQAEATARNISAAQSRLLENGKLFLDILSEAPSVRDLNPIACHTILSRLLARHPSFLSFAVFYPNGDRVCGSRDLQSRYNVSNRGWFKRALETQEFAIGEYHVGQFSGRPSLGLARPLLDSSGVLRGVVHASLDLDWVRENAVRGMLPPGGSFILVDWEGTILAFIPQPASGPVAGSNIATHEFFQTMRATADGSGLETTGIDGQSSFFYFFKFEPVSGSMVYASVGLPVEASREAADRRAWADIAILATVALVTIVVGYLLSARVFARPLQELAIFSRAVGAGRLDRRTGLGHLGNEVGELARNLDEMAESLAIHRAERQEQNQLLFETQEAGRIGSWQWQVGSPTSRCTPQLAKIYRLVPVAGTVTFADAFNRVHPEDRDRIKRALEEVGRTRTRGEAEYRLLFEDGEIRHFISGMWIGGEDSGQPVIHGFTQDITDRKNAAAENERNARFLEAMLDNIKDGILACNVEGELVVFNRWFEDLYGRKLDDFAGQKWIGEFEVYRPNGKTKLKKEELPLWRALHGERIANEELAIRLSGKTSAVIVNAQQIRTEAEGCIGAVVTARDITDLRRVEAALRNAQKLEAVGLLSGGIAHDFNNLLSIVIGNLDSLLLRLKDDRQREIANEALDGALRGATLVKQMLAFARRQRLEPEPVLVSQLISESESMWRRVAGDRVSVHTIFADPLWHCLVDPGELETALLNLVKNACDAMPDGGNITIEATNGRLDEEYAAQNANVLPGEYVQIAVTDSGFGIPPEILPRVIEPFFTTKEPGKGTGLGLSMVYGFIKQSEGHIRIYSEPGHGTTVFLYLPRARSSNESCESVVDSTESGLLPRTGRVLVVDDDEQVRSVAVSLLREMGCEVTEAHNVEAALSVLERDPDFRLILSDVVMPGGKSGFDLAEVVLNKYQKMKIILLTGFAENAAKGRSGVADHVELISKPYRRQDLAESVRRLLEH